VFHFPKSRINENGGNIKYHQSDEIFHELLLEAASAGRNKNPQRPFSRKFYFIGLCLKG